MDLLNQAACVGDVEEFKRLVNSGLDMKEADDYGMTPLSWATMNGQKAIVEFIMSSTNNLQQGESTDLQTKEIYNEEFDYDSAPIELKLQLKEEENKELRRRVAFLETQLMEEKRAHKFTLSMIKDQNDNMLNYQ